MSKNGKYNCAITIRRKYHSLQHIPVLCPGQNEAPLLNETQFCSTNSVNDTLLDPRRMLTESTFPFPYADEFGVGRYPTSEVSPHETFLDK